MAYENNYHIRVEPTFSGTTELWGREDLWESGENHLEAAAKIGIIPLTEEEVEENGDVSFLGEWGLYVRHITVRKA